MKYTLLAEPTHLTMQTREQFKVGLHIHNTGSTPQEPAWDKASLRVNGEPSIAWSLALQNGAYDPNASALGPKEETQKAWPLGEALFPEPGSYQLELQLEDSVQRLQVQVDP